MKNNFSTDRIENIMNSLSGIKPAAAPDFFYTRLTGKMQQGDEKIFFMLRPSFITVALSFFLVLNVFSLVSLHKAERKNFFVQKNQPANIESFAKAYNITGSESVYD